MKMNPFEYFLMTFDLGRQMYLKGIVKKLSELSHLPAGKKILEIGCGNGIGTRLISEIFQPDEFIATEYDSRLVEIARAKTTRINVTVEAGDAAALPFKDGQFDAVIGLSVIHHIPNWRKCVDELHRVLRPGGRLILKELSIETFESPFGRIARRFVDHPYDSMLRKSDFLAYLQEKRFSISEIHRHSMMLFLTDFLLVAEKQES